MLPKFIKDGYRAAYFGRPGPAFIDLPADVIMGTYDVPQLQQKPLPEPPKGIAPSTRIADIVNIIQFAKAPLIVIGKGAAYGKAEQPIRKLIEQ